MKILVRVIALVAIVLSSFGWVTNQAVAANLTDLTWNTSLMLAEISPNQNAADAKLTTEYGQKVDLNNANVRLFRKFRGFYPNLASTIVDNAPYNKVEDVLNIPGLSNTQKARLEANIDKFTVTPTSKVYNEGDDRYNPGYY